MSSNWVAAQVTRVTLWTFLYIVMLEDKGWEDPRSVNSPRRILSFSKNRKATVFFPDPDDRDSGFGVSGDQGPKTSEVYGFVGSITTVVATVLFLVWVYLPEHWLHSLGIVYYPSRLFPFQHLEQFIKARIPSITSLVNKSIDELESELDHLGRPIVVDAGAQLYTILELCRAFDKIFKEHLDGGRPGGDRIYGVFDNQLPAALRKLPFDRYLSVQNVRKVVSEADGYQPHLIAPEQGYRRLIEGALNYFRGPAEASVDAVHFVLKELVRKSIGECQELKRFPSLQSTIAAASNEALEKFRDEVDFFRKLPQEMETPKGGKPEASAAVDRYGEAHFRRIGSNVSSYVNMVSDTLRNTLPKAVVYCQVKEAKQSLLNYFYTQIGKKEGKALSELLDEDPALMERRMQCAKRLELYKKARDEIDSVACVR
ncbi:hypothetical protein KY290_002097 [Solanum tuberosum]|uniref:GED domain-containing protein n=1 Tax=Solanum tuberosum TaxID=4113 RepID=A0ABQ7WP27_SOLTU|nr:hypothetical protein KY284_002137 [Solanum tuberosum]KAH0733179.1 hypothetical protein KY289_004367 [Solanum tuberosum]KAH0782499.1 hypothetical protein KY290_002097 [Solanum tuberosum]